MFFLAWQAGFWVQARDSALLSLRAAPVPAGGFSPSSFSLARKVLLSRPPATRPHGPTPCRDDFLLLETQARFTFSFFFRIPPFAGNEISAEISPNFANSERKENSNSKNEISVNYDRKMMSVVIFVLFPRSNEKLLNTNFVQFFEIYNFCFRNFFI